jgi:hypothetical protein
MPLDLSKKSKKISKLESYQFFKEVMFKKCWNEKNYVAVDFHIHLILPLISPFVNQEKRAHTMTRYIYFLLLNMFFFFSLQTSYLIKF